MTDVTGVTDGANGAAAPPDHPVDARTWRVRRPEWVAHVLDDEAEPPRAVLLHLPSGRRTALSDTGTRMWQVIVASGQDGTTSVEIGDTLAPEYGVAADVIAHDVAGLVAEMVDGEWLEVVPESGAESEAGPRGRR